MNFWDRVSGYGMLALGVGAALVVFGLVMSLVVKDCNSCEDRGGAYVRNALGGYTCVQRQ